MQTFNSTYSIKVKAAIDDFLMKYLQTHTTLNFVSVVTFFSSFLSDKSTCVFKCENFSKASPHFSDEHHAVYVTYVVNTDVFYVCAYSHNPYFFHIGLYELCLNNFYSPEMLLTCV